MYLYYFLFFCRELLSEILRVTYACGLPCLFLGVIIGLASQSVAVVAAVASVAVLAVILAIPGSLIIALWKTFPVNRIAIYIFYFASFIILIILTVTKNPVMTTPVLDDSPLPLKVMGYFRVAWALFIFSPIFVVINIFLRKLFPWAFKIFHYSHKVDSFRKEYRNLRERRQSMSESERDFINRRLKETNGIW